MPILHGKNIMLREYRKEDLEYIRRWVNNPDIVDNLSDIFLYPHTLEDSEKYLKSILEKEGEKANFIIANKSTEEYIGQIDLLYIDWKNRFAEMGIIIGEDKNHRKGYGYEAIKLLQDYVFNRLNLNKLELKVQDSNLRAYNCYLKCGFKEEGRLRQRFFVKGAYRDYICMGILKSEFE